MLPITYALFLGVNAVAIIEVAESLANLSGQSPLSLDRWAVAILSFIAIFAFGLPLPVVFAGVAVYGAAIGAGRRRDLPFLQPPQRARKRCATYPPGRDQGSSSGAGLGSPIPRETIGGRAESQPPRGGRLRKRLRRSRQLAANGRSGSRLNHQGADDGRARLSESTPGSLILAAYFAG